MPDTAPNRPNPFLEMATLFRLTGGEPPEREAIEAAAAALGGNAADCMAFHDRVLAIRAAAGRSRVLVATFAAVRRFALSRIGAGDTASLSDAAGGTLPDGCAARLETAGADAQMRAHATQTAADHYAHHVMEVLSGLFGGSGETVAVVDGGTDTPGPLPYLRFLEPCGRTAGHA